MQRYLNASKIRAHTTTKEAVPILCPNCFLQPVSIGKWRSSRWTLPARDQVFFKALFFTGDRGSYLGLVRTEEILRFSQDDRFRKNPERWCFQCIWNSETSLSWVVPNYIETPYLPSYGFPRLTATCFKIKLNKNSQACPPPNFATRTFLAPPPPLPPPPPPTQKLQCGPCFRSYFCHLDSRTCVSEQAEIFACWEFICDGPHYRQKRVKNLSHRLAQ